MSGEQDKLSVSLEPPKLFGRKKKTPKANTASAPESADAPVSPDRAAEPDPHSEHDSPVGPHATGDTSLDPASEEARTETSVLPAIVESVDGPLMDEIHTGLPHDEDELAPPPASAPAGPSLVDRLRHRFGPRDRGEHPSATVDEPSDAESGTAYTAPMLDHYPAAMLAGAIVGLGMVTLTWLSLRGCEAVRGTASCGGGPGFLLLAAMFVISVMLGIAILKSFDVPDPGSSSFLAVGLVAVVSLLLFIDALDHWSMLLVIPVVTAGAYLLSVHITKTFVEPEG